MNDLRIIHEQKIEPIVSGMGPDRLIELVIQKGATIEILERLLALRERIQKDEAEKAFLQAMSAFQAECPVIPKKRKALNKDNTVRYYFASLDDIVDIAKPIIGKNGLSYDIEVKIISSNEFQGIEVTASVSHVLGHSKSSTFSVPIEIDAYMTDQQKWASAQTFAKRYAFCNAFGILTGDKDNDTNNLICPKKEKLKPQNPKNTDESGHRIQNLPDNIKEGFKILGYTAKAVWHFCDMREWDNTKIKNDINSIIDRQTNASKV